MNLERRDDSNTSSGKLPYLKSMELPSETNISEQPLSIRITGSFTVVDPTLTIVQSEDGDHGSKTVMNRHSDSVHFEPLDEEAERYLRENMTLPPIEEISGNTKYYINIARTHSDLSSANSVNEWWDFLDYDKECCNAPRADEVLRFYNQGHLAMNPKDESVCKKKSFPITKKKIMERKLNYQKAQEDHRAHVISDLENRMVSLYNLKKHYKKNNFSGGCKKESLSLPPIVGYDRLARHRDSLVNRIRNKKKENEDKLRKRLDRKLEIVQKILKEQPKSEVKKTFVASGKIKETNLNQKEYDKVQNNGPVESVEGEDEKEQMIDYSDTNLVNTQSVERIKGNILPENVAFLPSGPEVKLISDETPEIEPASVGKSPHKNVPSKKEKKKILKGTDNVHSKKEKKKKKVRN